MFASAETAALWFNIWTAVGLIGALLALLGGVGVWQANNAKEAFSEERSGLADVRLADAQKAAGEANERALQAQLALEQFRAPRTLTSQQIESIAVAIARVPGVRTVVGAVPPSKSNTDLMEMIVRALRQAKCDVLVNLNGVEASVSPTGSSNSGRMLSVGFPAGVTIFFVKGNERAKTYSLALARALRRAGLVASAEGGWREEWVMYRMANDKVSRDNPMFEAVTLVVGDKPVP